MLLARVEHLMMRFCQGRAMGYNPYTDKGGKNLRMRRNEDAGGL